ncbi:MAG: RloB domain-containing protein [Mucilaginibacter sp.]|nr:RloB domain-containing protein [Mucilaginibacter sp.]
MARVAKIDNSIKKRFARIERSRVVEVREKRVYFLIICEGEKTEPNYFEALKRDLPIGSLVVTDMTVKGTGKNTESLIDFSINYRKKSIQNFDRTWAVFDRDSFTEDQFNNAIIRAEANQINCAWSNEAFELWFLLHFQFVNNGMPRQDYQSFLEREIKKISKRDYVYKKNDTNTYSILKKHGNQTQAIVWAKSLKEQYNDGRHANHNPCTLVYLLIEELFHPEKLIQG